MVEFEKKIVYKLNPQKDCLFAEFQMDESVPVNRIDSAIDRLLKKFQNSTFFAGKYGVHKYLYEFDLKFQLYVEFSRKEFPVLPTDLMSDYIGYKDVTGEPVFIKISIENK